MGETTSAGVTALHFAASKGHVSVVEHLLASGAKRSLRDKRGGTPLHRAAGVGHEKVVKLLLDEKAEIKAKDKAGDNALHCAINGQHVAICAVLMGRDEAENMMMQENVDGKTPAQLLLDMQPIEVRDTLKSVWRDKQAC